FRIEGRLLRVLRHRIASGDPRVGQTAERASRHGMVVLAHVPAGADESALGSHADLFHRFDPAGRIGAGDTLIVLAIEGVDEEMRRAKGEAPCDGGRPTLDQLLAKAWRAKGRASTVVVSAAAVVIVAILTAMVVFPMSDRTLSTGDAFFTALVLMTGG